jgi:hypothetical protein
MGIGNFSSGLKLAGREAGHSPPSSVDVKNGGGVPPLTHTSSWRGVQPQFYLILFFLICIVGGGIKVTRHCGHQWPIVPAPGDYDDGEIGGMIGKGNRSTRRKPAQVPLCPPQTPHAAHTRTRAAAVGSNV